MGMIQTDLFDQFCHASTLYSQQTSLVDENGTSISYATLADKVRILYNDLYERQVQAGQCIGIYLERGVNMIASILASVACRAPFLLLDNATPLNRLKSVLVDATPVVIITNDHLAENLQALFHSERIIQVNNISDVEPVSKLCNRSSFQANDPLYIMYTSGSTGTPKGVVVPHQAIWNRFQWMWKSYPWAVGDRQLWKTSVTFGDSIWEMLGGLLQGVPTVIASNTVANDPMSLSYLIHRERVTRLTVVPTMLLAILKAFPNSMTIQQQLDSLKITIASGEVLTKSTCALFCKYLPNVTLINLYGSTEIGNDVTYHEISSSADYQQYESIPIGKPIDNIDYLLLDSEGGLSTNTGQLLITGVNLLIGYLNQPEQTASKLVTIDGKTYFKTGDLVRICPKTQWLIFLSRTDNQVKIRGCRVELEEVESVLIQHSAVTAGGCFLTNDSTQRLIALYTAQKPVDQDELIDWMTSNLPTYAVPSGYVYVETIPRTSSGKLDRAQLPALYVQHQSRINYDIDCNNDNLRSFLCSIWRRLLNIENGHDTIQKTFTQLGGHSLLAIKIQRELYSHFSIHIPIHLFFTNLTLLDLCKSVDDYRNNQSMSPHRFLPLTSGIDMRMPLAVPLTAGQKGIWIDDELSTGTDARYNIEATYEILDDRITRKYLIEAVQCLVERHHSLRTVFERNEDGEIVQVVKSLSTETVNNTPILILHDFSTEQSIDSELTRFLCQKFDLNQSKPCFVCHIISVAGRPRVLCMIFHHIIVDGWSIAVLARELNQILQAFIDKTDLNQRLSPVQCQFHQYVAHLNCKTWDTDVAYWKEKLSNGAMNFACLPSDHETYSDVAGASFFREISPVLLRQIQSTCQSMDITSFMVLLATFDVLLARYTTCWEDIVVATPVFNRSFSEMENTVGFFVNVLLMRVDLSADPTFDMLMIDIKRTVLQAFEHQEAPFTHVTSKLEQLDRDSHVPQLFQVLFAYQNVGEMASTNLLRKMRVENPTAKCDLEVHLWEDEHGALTVHAQYRKRVFKASTVERLVDQWLTLTESALNNPDARMSEWSMMSEDEKVRLLHDFSQSPRNDKQQPLEKTLCQLFHEQVVVNGKVPSLEYDGHVLTYTQLWSACVNASWRIRDLSKTLESDEQVCIALMTCRSIQAVQTMLSVLLAGYYYVNIDPDLPIERKTWILHETGAVLLIIDGLESTVDDHAANFAIPTVTFASLLNQMEKLVTRPEQYPAAKYGIKPDHLAYTIFTSGSTGTPKGVRTTHKNIICRTVDVGCHSIRPGYRVGQLCSLSFDVSTFEIYATLLNGGTLVIVGNSAIASCSALASLHLDMINPPTAVFNLLAKQSDAAALFSTLDTVIFAGEKANPKCVQAVRQYAPKILINGYGPTETTHNALCYTITEDSSACHLIPIGRPLPNTYVYVADCHLKLVPIGVPGELLIGGSGVSIGYFNDIELSAQKFVPNPFTVATSPKQCNVVYRTGDIVRMLNDGNIEYLHRIDNQVKIRSQRIELGEIESRLLDLREISEAVVILRNDVFKDNDDDQQYLVAYVVMAESISITEEQIRRHLTRWLPHHMIPSFIIVLEKMPLNAIGKINRRMLPKPAVIKSVRNTVFHILASVLKKDPLPGSASFLELGGHSLFAMEVMARLHQSFGITTSVRQLFQSVTLNNYADQIEQMITSQLQSPTTTDHKQVSTPFTGHQRLDLLPAQRQFWFLWKLAPNNACYNVPIALTMDGHLDRNVLHDSLHHLMERHELLRTVYEEQRDGTIRQRVQSQWTLPFTEVDLAESNQSTERLQFYITQPFDLKRGPTCRFVLLHARDNSCRHIFLMVFHHITCDGHSLEYFLDELAQLYSTKGQGKTSLSSNDTLLKFIHERTLVNETTQLEQTDTIINHLIGYQQLPLQTDVSKNEQSTTQMELGHPAYVSYVELTPALADKLRKLSAMHDCTLFTLLLTLYKCVLSVFSGNFSDILVGSVLSTRKSLNAPDDLFAPMINTLALRTILPGNDDATLADIIKLVKETVLLAMENQACSYADVVTRLRSVHGSSNERQQPFLPLFRVLFEMNSYRLVERQHQFDDNSMWSMYTELNMVFPFTKSDIDLHAVENGYGSSIHVSFRANTRLLQTSTIEKVAQCFLGAVELVVREPYCTKHTLWTELHIIRSGLVIHECFLNQVRQTPTAICLVQDHLQWSFQQLHDHIISVANVLQENFHVHPGTVVALCMNRSAHLIVAMFGVLMAGATYVYLDPTLPLQRILKMMELTSSTMILFDNDTCKLLRSNTDGMIKIALIDELYNQLRSADVSDQNVLVKPTDTCYVIFTSGTTGEPKGICIQHQAVVRRARMLDYLRIDPTSRIAHVSSCSFDGYILEVYGALLNGACVVVYNHAQVMEPKLLANLFRRDSITHVYLPTPLFNTMAEYVPKAFAGMVSVMSAGDRANAKLMRRVLVESEPPPQQLVNAYGPTETTCISTWYYVTLSALNNLIKDGCSVPIGTGLPDTPLYIVRPNTLELADDHGELLVGGFGVSSGYFNLPDQTAVKFLSTNPFSPNDQRPLYRSGDHVRRLADGNLEFIGRFDNQVKIDGCRIELAEIESHIKNHSDVLDSVVIVRKDIIPNSETIVAYVKPESISPLEIQQYLIKHLPRYMIPTYVMPVVHWPIAGGKIDRRGLPKPGMSSERYINSAKPIAAEKSAGDKLQDAWQHVLGNERSFKGTDDFFLCGGKSFTVVHLHSMLETLFHIDLDIVQLFVHTTFAQQLQWLTSSAAAKNVDHVITSHPAPLSTHHVHQRSTDDNAEKIAIIGMSARYGTTETVDDLWTELCNGSDLCTRVSHNELRKQKHLIEILKCYPNYVQARCMMSNANCFDHVFFKMTKRDADITDPQHRILLEVAYEALEDAGLVPENYHGTIGVFGSVLPNTYAEVYRLFKPCKTPDELTSSAGMDSLDPASIMRIEIGNMTDGAPTFVAYKLGLTGPAMAIQTACSSSGTALHVALRCIETGDCDVALVAGVSISYPLEAGYIYQPGMVMSKTGFCRSFDERADGVVGGDGVGVIVLMKAKEALRSGYSIRTLITGHAVNNDGYKKNSFAITNSDMQAACMSQALRTAHIKNAINEIGFVEAHGSGTSLGDLLEVQALTKAYGNGNNSLSKIYLGSIKPNIGHAAHAGTLASIIKTTLIVETGLIPPTVHFQQFSPLIAHLQHPFTVNSACVNWSQMPRRAAVNTLGQGGTNSHFILEQFMSSTTNDSTHMSSEQIFIFSAKDLDALNHIKQKLIGYLPKLKASQRDHVAYTLACGRATYDVRDFITATSLEQLSHKLLFSQPCTEPSDAPVRIVFLLPGQGAQFFGMARDLHRNYLACAKITEQCISYIADSGVRQIIVDCLLTTKPSMQSDWNLQCYAQLSLFIVEYALAKLFISLNVKPDYLIGHSSGELVAACLSHVFTVEAAIRLLERRCQLMISNDRLRGSMLAVQVHGDADRLRDEFAVEIAAINSKSQYVFAGTCANIKRMQEQLQLREPSRKVTMLHTANAFHSSFMHPICEQLKSYMNDIRLQDPSIPIVSTVTGTMIREREMTKTDYWADHLKQPVLFGPAIEHLLASGNESFLFIQVGPGKSLLSLVQNIESNAKMTPPCLLENDQSNSFLNCIGTLWSQGAVKNMDWSSLFNASSLKRISLPTYPFKRIVCVASTQPQITDLEKLTGNALVDTCLPPADVPTLTISNNTRTPTTTGNAPWNIRKSNRTIIDGCSVKRIKLSSEKIHSPTLNAGSPSLQLGFYTSVFTRALYFDCIHSGMIEADTLLIDLLPEDMPANLPAHVSRLSLQQLAAGSTGLLSTPCKTIQDLLHALSSSTVNLSINKDSPDIFAISLLGHTLAAISQMSYAELIHDKVFRPLALSSTNIIGDDCYAPALRLHSTVGDMEHLLMSVYGRCTVPRLPILDAIRKAFENYEVPLAGTEQIIPIFLLDSDQALLITSNDHIRKSAVQTIVQRMTENQTMSIVNKLSSSDYSNVIIKCVCLLTGCKMENCSKNMTFEQLGVDSLQAITLVDLLSRQIGAELPVDIVYKYPTIVTLADGLRNLLKVNDGASAPLPTTYILNSQAGMPKVHQSSDDRSLIGLLKFISCAKSQLLSELTQYGALLFRDFDVFTADEFAQVARALATTNKSFSDYKDGISKRLHVADNVFTSTEYPKHADLALHNEMSYAAEMPTQLFFFCEIPPASGCGGETPLGDSQEIYRSVDPTIRAAFINRKLLYVHNMPNQNQGLGKSWQDTYRTESRLEVEQFLRSENIDFSWQPNGSLRTTRLADAVKRHPVTGEWLWCNHAHLFHPSDLLPDTRRTLESRLAPMDMPKNCFFADNGQVIPERYLTHVRHVLQTHQIKWLWQRGDVLLLDNYRIAHGRAAFSGDRRILVAMC